ncbi:unnamed protein product [marine sediment metagenome]|uniref:PHA accumulation regulator DNA-binding N-terminal domain-containing protein n=1 Tax=marine sediment metagenome TaxID=412755 RepID=X1PA41_9ZZZZ
MIIKKYKNRKYYCIDKSKFVVLNFIIGLIRRKEEFVIVNNRNDDITKQILLKLLRRELRKNAIQKEKKNII